MPYRWEHYQTAPELSGAVCHEVTVWPHRALSPVGFVWFIAITAGLVTLPMLTVLGSPVLWGLLPFIALAVGGIWYALRRSWRVGETSEVLRLDTDRLELTRHDPGRSDRHWQANPYWVRLALRRDGPVEDYLTLAAEGREVELGAFLSPEERRALHDELRVHLREVRQASV